MPHWQQEFLKENYKFYRSLSEKNQRLFEHRVVRFIEHHNFIGKDGFQVTHKIELLIAGTAIMLSFGYTEYLYSLFSTIIIYPKDYFSTITNQQHKGETNPQFGVVVFSWEDFKAGLVIENDNLHLGLHEFTHALHFSYKHTKSRQGVRFLNNFDIILSYLTQTSVQKKLIETAYIRSYAFENKYEFLAVLVEHFFETPEKFKREHPKIFDLMLQLLQFKNELG